jgi:hypothetical protein
MDNDKKRKNLLDSSSLLTFGLILISVAFVWYLAARYLYNNYYACNPEEAGQLGDTLGAVNSFFSAAAFAGIFFTILLQRKELKETRDVFVEEHNTFKLQRFENILFNVLALHNELTNSIRYSNYQGRVVFDRIISEQLGSDYTVDANALEEHAHYDLEVKYSNDHYPTIRPIVEHYLRSLENVVRIIDMSESVKDHQKSVYYQIVAANISRYETEFLYIHYHYHIVLAIDKGEPDIEMITDKLKLFKHFGGPDERSSSITFISV